MESGGKPISNQEKFRGLARRFDNAVAPFARAWGSAKGLFYPGRVESTLEKSHKDSDLQLAAFVFVLAAVVTFCLSVISTFEAVHLIEYTSGIIADLGGTAHALGLEDVWVFIVLQYVIQVPVFLLLIAVHETLFYFMARATGGKGKFAHQFYLSSLVSLSMAMLSVLQLFVPLPCIDFLAIAGFGIGAFYLVVYVNTKAYSRVHGIGYWHALALNLALLIPRLLVIYFLTAWLAAFLGLGSFFGF